MLFRPGRAVKYYLIRTEQYCPNCSNLFVSTGHVRKKVSRYIAYLVRDIINNANKVDSEEDCTVVMVKAQKVNSTVSTLLFKKNVAFSQVMWTGMWRPQTTLLVFYLRDVTKIYGQFFHRTCGDKPACLEISGHIVVTLRG